MSRNSRNDSCRKRPLSSKLILASSAINSPSLSITKGLISAKLQSRSTYMRQSACEESTSRAYRTAPNPELFTQLTDLKVLQPDAGSKVFLKDLFGCFGGHFLDLNSPLGRRHHDGTRGGPIEYDAENRVLVRFDNQPRRADGGQSAPRRRFGW